tara:strand:+ start:29428 stop:29583 length:156 start_codon:yes stop_codon:yes gene_type:complete
MTFGFAGGLNNGLVADEASQLRDPCPNDQSILSVAIAYSALLICISFIGCD